ncbi:MAG TPA: DUF6328 family protein [Solirubrobacteraceae bacterium]|jgi:hypothetical protein|nr:DUF6328 family protein [Solirubrobacteraceae bacterium]
MTSSGPTPDRDETPHERVDRNLGELMGELRVVITGVQALFAFLLVVPFDSRFSRATSFERGAYFVALVCAALSALCMIAPSAHHRLVFREHDKARLMRNANRLTLTGLAFLALAMTGSLLLIATTLFGPGAGTVTGALALTAFAAVWLIVPLRPWLRPPRRTR